MGRIISILLSLLIILVPFGTFAMEDYPVDNQNSISGFQATYNGDKDTIILSGTFTGQPKMLTYILFGDRSLNGNYTDQKNYDNFYIHQMNQAEIDTTSGNIDVTIKINPLKTKLGIDKFYIWVGTENDALPDSFNIEKDQRILDSASISASNTQVGYTTVNLPINSDYVYSINNSSISPPNQGSVIGSEYQTISNGTELYNFDNIGKYIVIIEKDLNGNMAKYYQEKITIEKVYGVAKSLNVDIAPGITEGYSRVTATANSGNRIVYKLQNSSIPFSYYELINDSLAESDIDGELGDAEIELGVNKYIALFEVDDRNFVVKYYTTSIIPSMYKPYNFEAEELKIDVVKGSRYADSIKLKYEDGYFLGEGNHLVYKINDNNTSHMRDEIISTAIESGRMEYSIEGADDIINVKENDEITVYEISNATNALVKYNKIIITKATINQFAITKIQELTTFNDDTDYIIKNLINAHCTDSYKALNEADFNKYNNLSSYKQKATREYIFQNRSNQVDISDMSSVVGLTDIEKEFGKIFNLATDYAISIAEQQGTGGNPSPPSNNKSNILGVGTFIPVVQNESQSKFNDLSNYLWATEAIEALHTADIVTGINEDEFAPASTVTREQFIKVLVKVFKLYDETSECNFSDADKGSWYYRYVASAVKAGITNGFSENTFGVGVEMTREQAATMLYRAIKATNTNMTESTEILEFADNLDISEWARMPVLQIQKYGLMNGNDSKEFLPNENLIRAELAVTFFNVYKLLK